MTTSSTANNNSSASCITTTAGTGVENAGIVITSVGSSTATTLNNSIVNCNNNPIVGSGTTTNLGQQQQQQNSQSQSNANTCGSNNINNNNNNNSSITNNVTKTLTTVSNPSASGNSSIKSLMSVKEEPNLIESKNQIKHDDESPSSTPPQNITGCINNNNNKEQRLNSNSSANSLTSNNSVIGLNNIGSLHHIEKNINESSVGDDLLGSKDNLLSDSQSGISSLGTIVASIKKEEIVSDSNSDNFVVLNTSSLSGNNNNTNNTSGCCTNTSGVATDVIPSQVRGGNNNNNNNRINTSITDNIQPLNSNVLSGGNCNIKSNNNMTGMDYMQQQNHIFVFSTQLANKGAESVLNGQYPTIIAYHCAQPSTKKFLEDFFLKNPMKLSKMNRQNQSQWMNSNITILGKTKGNSTGGNINNNTNNSNRLISTSKTTTNPSLNNSGFPVDDITNDTSELLPWEQTTGIHLNLETLSNGPSVSNNNINQTSSDPNNVASNTTNNVSSGIDVDALVSGTSPSLNNQRNSNSHMIINSTTSSTSMQQSPTTNSTVGGPTSPSLNSSLQPSLQGVKVPDENLTPQQRQHREEQLAKLKKMNQFLFPEHGGDFVSGNIPSDVDQNITQNSKLLSGSGSVSGPVSSSMLGGIHNNNNSNGTLQMQGNLNNINVSLRGANMMNINQRGNNICRSMGPMGSNVMQDNIMPSINDITGMSCNMVTGMINNQSGIGNTNNSTLGGMIGNTMGQQAQNNPLGIGGHLNPCSVVSGPMGSIMGQNKHMIGGPGVAQLEWSKLQHQFYEERKGKNMDTISIGGMCSGSRQLPQGVRNNHQNIQRSQGPPPPYHQTQRSASVPIATQSPNPSSPNNPTSNLSLPSPRAGSTLNSPAASDNILTGNNNGGSTGTNNPGRTMPYTQDSPVTSCANINSNNSANNNNNQTRTSMTHSNPSTPVSSHLSPNASLKELELANSVSGTQGKEPNLMPVPSPQQIQYLNTFEGQELTIQKQPNTTLKDGCIISPSGGNSGIGTEVTTQGSTGNGNCGNDTRMQGTNNSSGLENRFSSPSGGNSGNQVLTNNSIGNGQGGNAGSGVGGIITTTTSTFPIPSSPQTQNTFTLSSGSQGEKNSRLNASVSSSQGSRAQSMSNTGCGSDPNQNSNSIETNRFPSASPGISFGSVTGGSSNHSNAQANQIKMSGFLDVSPNGKCNNNDMNSSGNFCVRTDNMPLNPNSSCQPPAKSSHFDPISSLAQMSQQLTSSVSSTLNGQPNVGSVVSGNGNVGNPGGNIMGNYQNHSGIGMSSDLTMSGHHVDGLMGGMDHCGLSGVIPGMGQYGMHNSSGPALPLGMIGNAGPRSLSPKLGGGMIGFPPGPVGMSHRLIGRPSMSGNPFNGANIQVKASTPNTIQYLPARPQVGNTNPRAPPSLDFLQRFANPMSSMDGTGKMPPGQNMPFFSNCNQLGQNTGVNIGMDGNVLSNAESNAIMSMGGMGPGGPIMSQNMLMRGLRPPGQSGMVRIGGPSLMNPGNHHHNPFSNGPLTTPQDPSIFPGNQLFTLGGNKNNPMNMSGSNGPVGPNHPSQLSGGGIPPDASQPLPPTMGGQGPGNTPNNNNNSGPYKTSQFVGPSTADPNYAQQYHNFQQQLYATSTRSQINNSQPGGMTGPPNPNQSFFVPK